MLVTPDGSFKLLKTIYVHLLACYLNKLQNARCNGKDNRINLFVFIYCTQQAYIYIYIYIERERERESLFRGAKRSKREAEISNHLLQRFRTNGAITPFFLMISFCVQG